MVTCAKCGTGWTSSGLPICPVCGAKVVEPAPARRSDGLPLIDLTPGRKSAPAVLEVPVLKEVAAMNDAPVAVPKPDSGILPVVDPSAGALSPVRSLPSPTRPINGPLILGVLAYAGVVMLPLTIAFEHQRVLGVLGFCMTGFFAPFAPIAWMAGLVAEKRRRDQGLRPEGRVTIGRLLGQWGTLLLVAEITLALVAIAALRLSGKFPLSFWTPIA